MWDYYKDKMLKSLVMQHEFDFERVSRFFSKNDAEHVYTADGCRERWDKIYKEEKKGGKSMSNLSLLLNQLEKENNNTNQPLPSTANKEDKIRTSIESEDKENKIKKIREEDFLKSMQKKSIDIKENDCLLM